MSCIAVSTEIRTSVDVDGFLQKSKSCELTAGTDMLA